MTRLFAFVLLASLATVLSAAPGCSSTEEDAPPPEVLEYRPDLLARQPVIREADQIVLGMDEFVLTGVIQQDLLKGTGLVYGLGGSGYVPDSTVEANRLRQQLSQLKELELIPDYIGIEDFEEGRCALVTVVATFPRDRAVGSKFDLTIINDQKIRTFKDGRLWPVKLTDANLDRRDDEVYALTVQDLSAIQPLWGASERRAQEEADRNPDAPAVRIARWRVPQGGYLVKELPTGRTSDETIVLSLAAYNRDILDGMKRSIRVAGYPFDVHELSGGLGRGKLAVEMAAGFSMTAEDVMADLGTLPFTVANTRVPLVVFDNRSGEIIFVGGSPRFRRRWMATSHVPDPESPDFDLAKHVGIANDPASKMFSWGSVLDSDAPGMKAVPFVVAGQGEKFDDIRKELEDGKIKPADRVVGSMLTSDSRLRVISWKPVGEGGGAEQEIGWLLERNDLRDVLACLRDELGFPGPALKEFVLEANKRGYFDECFVLERHPRVVLSQARDMAFYPDTRQVAVGNIVLRGRLIDGAEDDTWDLLPGPLDPDNPNGPRGFVANDVRRIGQFMTTIDGNEFAWRDHEGETRHMTIRLSPRVYGSFLRARIQMVMEDQAGDGGANGPMLEGVDRATALLAEDLVGTIERNEKLKQFASLFENAISYLEQVRSRMMVNPGSVADWEQQWPGRPTPANGIRVR